MDKLKTALFDSRLFYKNAHHFKVISCLRNIVRFGSIPVVQCIVSEMAKDPNYL